MLFEIRWINQFARDRFMKYCTEIGCNVRKSNKGGVAAMPIKLEAPLKVKVVLPKGSKLQPLDMEKEKMERILPKEETV